jgi:hypothetical protein
MKYLDLFAVSKKDLGWFALGLGIGAIINCLLLLFGVL